MRLLAVATALVFASAVGDAQLPQSSRTIEVTETAGIRRTEYPVTARIEFARAALPDASHARLRLGQDDVPAQFTAEARWDDRSVRALSIDFNVSIGPAERRSYTLDVGDSRAVPFTGRGLTVTENPDTIQAGPIRFSKSGAPLVQSAAFAKSEFIGQGVNGVAVEDKAGKRHDLSAARNLSVEMVKTGPLNVTLRYSGRFVFDANDSASIVVTVEMPNSKSWVKVDAAVQDVARRLVRVRFDSPLAFGAHPWTWDLSTERETYGAIRGADDRVVHTQTVTSKGPAGWLVNTQRDGASMQPYESSPTGAAARGWGHLQDLRTAVAFGVDRFARDPGSYSISLDGRGQTTFSYEPAPHRGSLRLTVFQHFVSAPVPIGAATSPAAMLSPLRVDVK
jgi:hypothetical protein